MNGLSTIRHFWKFLSIVTCFQILVNPSLAKVDPQNYNFSLDSLKAFFPGQKIADLEKTHGKGHFVKNAGPNKIHRFYVAQIRYKFPVYIQEKDGVIIDMFAKLPSYFNHDLYHQSLINRYGKQDEYLKQENNAIYGWRGKKGIDITYSGSCTITCFPIYMAVSPNPKPKKLGNFKTLLKIFSADLRAQSLD